ncbi:MAG TPA: rhodanese-like domain-containing protein [Saprospiraceae bacterium]|nr:rhodanese-like domain-containing protein [Saprospiraceae bacterium]HMP25648.1 rhodanese-like domain-containing protein [Saprospiraceae bacterium]
MKKTFLFLTMIAFSAAACQSQDTAQNGSKVVVLAPPAYKEKIENGTKVQLVDVRTSAEYQAGHIGDAANIDYLAEDFEQQIQSLNKDQPVYVYCQVGGRSSKAAKVMQALGFREIYDLQGGYLAWR